MTDVGLMPAQWWAAVLRCSIVQQQNQYWPTRGFLLFCQKKGPQKKKKKNSRQMSKSENCIIRRKFNQHFKSSVSIDTIKMQKHKMISIKMKLK